MTHKLLLDENLSPKIADTLCREDGVDAVHVCDRGLLRTADDALLERAFQEDRVLVTCNVADFVRFAKAREIHGDLVLVEEGDQSRADQLKTIRRALDALAGKPDMANHVLRIWLDGRSVFEEIPPV